MEKDNASKLSFIDETKMLVKENIFDYAMLIALVIIVTFFTIKTNGKFISPGNIKDLINQTGYLAVLAVGMTLIIIINQIDLTVGYMSGYFGAVAAVLLVKQGLPTFAVIPIVLLFGAAVGFVNGTIISRVGVPAFIMTLAGMFIFRGMLLSITNETGTIVIPDETFNQISNGFIPNIGSGSLNITAILIGVACVVLFVLAEVNKRRKLQKYDFYTPSLPIFIAKISLVSAVVMLIVWNQAHANGLSYTVVIVAIVVAIYSFVMNKTPLGRYIYGIGGSVEAAELSGVNVKLITTLVFSSMSMLAALSGMMYASRLQSATPTSGAGMELYAVASAFIGGASASGGIGKVTNSIIGALIITSLTSGMNILGWQIYSQYKVIGLIFILAVAFDVNVRKK